MTFDGSKPLDHLPHEDFAQAVVRLGNQTAAWREVYKPGPHVKPRVAWEDSCKLARRMDISIRIDWLRAQAFERSQISVANLMRDLYDIATADPTELTQMLVTNCRHCHGEGFKWQWVDAEEFATECERIEMENALATEQRKRPAALPTCDGGFGYDHHAQPNPLCPHCLGVGIRTPWVGDTSGLSDKARKLFKGVKVKGDGSVEILMHDQLQARDQLHKLAGAYKVNADGLPAVPAAATQDGAKPADPAQTYLTLVHGGRAA